MDNLKKRSDFEEELETLLNKHGKDAELNVSDFWLADFLNSTLDNLDDVLVHHTRDGANTVEIEDNS